MLIKQRQIVTHMVSENVKKLVECEKKAKEMVNRARNERADLLALAKMDADTAIAKLREQHQEIISKKREKQQSEITTLIKELKREKEKDLREFGSEAVECEDLIDEIVNMVSGATLSK